MRLRKRAGGLVLGALTLFVIGTNVQAGWLYVMAALLLGSVAVGVLMPLIALRGLAAELVAPAEVSQGQEALVEIRVTNRGRGLRWSVGVEDEHLEPADLFVAAIRPGERVEVATMRHPQRRGVMLTQTVVVRSAAPFGVAERRRRLRVDATTLVLPAVLPLGPLPFIEPVGTHDVGIHTSPRPGTGPEFLGVRDYRPGDSMRHVHWRLTARHGSMMVREHEEERTRRLAVVVDTERDVGPAWTPLDRCCAVAASVVETATAHGHGARLVGATGPSTVDVVSRMREAEAMRWLARLEQSGMALEDVLGRLGADELRGVDTVVVATPDWAGRDGARLAGTLSRLPVRTVVCVPVGLTQEERARPNATASLEPLVAAGIDVRPWFPGTDLAFVLGARRER